MVPRIAALLDTIADERRRFERFCRSLTAEQLDRPVPGSDWRVRAFIAHVATLDGAYAGWIAQIAGDTVSTPHRGSTGFDVDRFNEAEVGALRGRDVDDILTHAARCRAALVAALERLGDEQLDAEIRFGGDRKRPPSHLPLGRFLQNWARHDAIHVADMLKALPERRDDPEVTAWLGRPDTAPIIDSYRRAMG